MEYEGIQRKEKNAMVTEVWYGGMNSKSWQMFRNVFITSSLFWRI
jgi:hypothetical protein